jgi:hypothetical protein
VGPVHALHGAIRRGQRPRLLQGVRLEARGPSQRRRAPGHCSERNHRSSGTRVPTVVFGKGVWCVQRHTSLCVLSLIPRQKILWKSMILCRERLTKKNLWVSSIVSATQRRDRSEYKIFRSSEAGYPRTPDPRPDPRHPRSVCLCLSRLRPTGCGHPRQSRLMELIRGIGSSLHCNIIHRSSEASSELASAEEPAQRKSRRHRQPTGESTACKERTHPITLQTPVSERITECTAVDAGGRMGGVVNSGHAGGKQLTCTWMIISGCWVYIRSRLELTKP